MMQKIGYTVCAAVLLVLVACSGNADKNTGTAPKTMEAMEEQLKSLEDSLKNGLLDANNKANAIRYAENCLEIYQAFPSDEKAPKYLDKAHMIFSSAGLHGRAVLYADTLIRKYPRYNNRPMVLLSLASAHDMFIVPRKKELVRKYYQLLLKENPNLPKEEKESYQFRLDHIDLTYDELIDLQMQKPVNQ